MMASNDRNPVESTLFGVAKVSLTLSARGIMIRGLA